MYLTSAGGLNGLHWSWVKVQPAASLPTAADQFTVEDVPLFTMAEPVVAEWENAREVNNHRAIDAGTIVRIEFCSYDRAGEPTFIFSHHPQQGESSLPIHDHRDNSQGGFAFSVYHPGSGLPQQPWAI